MKSIVPNDYLLISDEFDDIKSTLLIDENERYFSNLNGIDVKFDEEVKAQIRDIISMGLEPMIDYKDGQYIVTAIEEA